MAFESPATRWRGRVARIVSFAALSAVALGCAPLANTSAQDVAWSRWTACHKEVTGTDLNTVQMDGRISFWYSGAGDSQSMLACLHQAASAGPSLPEPIPELRPGGSGGGGGAM